MAAEWTVASRLCSVKITQCVLYWNSCRIYLQLWGILEYAVLWDSCGVELYWSKLFWLVVVSVSDLDLEGSVGSGLRIDTCWFSIREVELLFAPTHMLHDETFSFQIVYKASLSLAKTNLLWLLKILSSKPWRTHLRFGLRRSFRVADSGPSSILTVAPTYNDRHVFPR